MQVLDTQYRASQSPRFASECAPLLRISGLTVAHSVDSGREASVVKDVTFPLAAGKIVGLLGESGSGKTTVALSILGSLLPTARITAGSIQFRENDLLKLNEEELRKIRGSQISIIHQDSDVLNPVMRAGDQVLEVLRAHKRSGVGRLTVAQMREEIHALFSQLGLDDCHRIYRSYPHQLSGGQRRRIAIAQALICEPQIVIADEPTSWLDINTTGKILGLFTKMRDEHATTFLLITHEPEILAAVADEVLVMYGGEIVESGPTREVLAQPMHPYTQALLQCAVKQGSASTSGGKRALPFITGQAPDPGDWYAGCRFANRCPERIESCDSQRPVLLAATTSRLVRCLKRGAGA